MGDRVCNDNKNKALVKEGSICKKLKYNLNYGMSHQSFWVTSVTDGTLVPLRLISTDG